MSISQDCIVPVYGNSIQPAKPIWGRPPPYPRAYASMLDPEAIRGLGVAAECVPCVTSYKTEHAAWEKRAVVKVMVGTGAAAAAGAVAGYAIFRNKRDPVPGVIAAIAGGLLGTLGGMGAAYVAVKGSEP